MSLITRCPACSTTFRVVRDQLRISDGWVRCGRCSHVFDASLDLRELSDAEPASTAASPAPPSEPEPEAEPPAVAQVADPEPVVPAGLPALPGLSLGEAPPAGLVADEPWPEAATSGFDDLTSTPTELKPARSVAEMAPSLDLDLVGQIQLQKALRRARIKALKIARAQEKTTQAAAAGSTLEMQNVAQLVQTPSEPEPPAAPPTAVPSFLRVASSPAFWRSVRGKGILGAGIALAVLLLSVQVIHRERDAIAASQPGLRPLLESVCGVTGCELAALRRIDEITIDGAAFAREKVGDGYRLSFTLRNAASVPLSMPAIELTLLDTQEQAVIRRVLLPAEFGAPAVLPARAERASSLPLVLSGTEAAVLPPIAGYRVVAFYP
jgi:predicted Zn finger-like uncharacterized protein